MAVTGTESALRNTFFKPTTFTSYNSASTKDFLCHLVFVELHAKDDMKEWGDEDETHLPC